MPQKCLQSFKFIKKQSALKSLQPSARAVVRGNLYYRLIEVVVGARIDGQLNHLIADDTGNG